MNEDQTTKLEVSDNGKELIKAAKFLINTVVTNGLVSPADLVTLAVATSVEVCKTLEKELDLDPDDVGRQITNNIQVYLKFGTAEHPDAPQFIQSLKKPYTPGDN